MISVASALAETVPDARVAEVVDLHFDPERGSRFWLERAARLDFDPREEIRTADDLPRLGPLHREDLVGRPLLDLVPAALHGRRDGFVLSETGGALGRPLRAAFSPDEFAAGFVEPFRRAARERGFPERGVWLFAGPSGPHVIHRTARAFARAAGDAEPFSVDFDPRWARAQSPGSVGARAYLEHVVAQAVELVESQGVTILFSTPPVLRRLGEELAAAARDRIMGIHVGGMAWGAGDRRRIEEAFPRAVVLPAYGNSLAGIAPEVFVPGAPASVIYAVPTGRVRFRVLDRPADGVWDEIALRRITEPGGRGRVVLDRVDPTLFLANLLERDEARVVAAPLAMTTRGVQPFLLADPGAAAETPAREGIY